MKWNKKGCIKRWG